MGLRAARGRLSLFPFIIRKAAWRYSSAGFPWGSALNG